MKKILLAIAALLPVWCYAQNGDYTLQIKLQQLKKPATAYVVQNWGFTNLKVLDSAKSSNGTFKFKGNAQEPIKVDVVVTHNGKGIKNGDKKSDDQVVYLEQANIRINGTDSVKTAEISGSKLNEQYAIYDKAVNIPIQASMDSVNAEYAAASPDKRKDQNFVNGLMAHVRKALARQDSLKIGFIRQHPDCYFSLEALIEVAGSAINVPKIEPLFNSLSGDLKSSPKGVAFKQAIDAARAVSIGAPAMDFTENDVNDQPVKLSDFRGKYVLVDFWASWCGPCRGENPNVLKAYNKYKDKNFTILGVSLDNKKEPWLAAIKADSLTWTEVSDLGGWNNKAAKMYFIRSIPQNFLVGPDGKILARNLRGPALEEELAKLIP